MVNKKRLINITRSLIQIDSQNPPGDESRIAIFVHRYMLGLGLKSKIYCFQKKRANVISVLKGKDKKRSLLITPHLDTVPAGNSWHFNPFGAKIIKNRIYGLGATDCKGNLACAMETIASLVEDGLSLNYNLIFAATADEESGSEQGLVGLLSKGILKPDAAVVLDADGFDIIITQKGLIHLKIKIQGKRAHGAYPQKGENAIDKTLRILADLKTHKFIYQKNSYLKPPTMNIGTIKGGDKVNVVADWCESELDFRFLPGMSEQKILRHIKRTVSKYARKFKIEIEGIQRPYFINKVHPLVSYLSQAMKKNRVSFSIRGSEGATVITFFQDKHIPAIATGFGTEGCAHVADEHVSIDSLYRGSRVLEDFLKNYQFH